MTDDLRIDLSDETLYDHAFENGSAWIPASLPEEHPPYDLDPWAGITVTSPRGGLTAQQFLNHIREESDLLTPVGDQLMEEWRLTDPVPLPEPLINQVYGVRQERASNHGRPLINFLRICLMWSVRVGKVITPEDTGWMMDELKDARDMHSVNPDNLVDGIGYLDCIDDMHRHMIELGYPEGRKTFRLWLQSGEEEAFGKLWGLYRRLLDEKRPII
jgi:hypothetical protein